MRTQLALLKPKIEKAKNELAAASAELANLMGEAEAGSLTLRGRMPSVSTKDLTKYLNLKDYELPELTNVRLQRKKSMMKKP